MPGLADAIKYLSEGQKLYRFSNEFLGKPEVQSWIFQALYAASAADSLPYELYAEHKKLGDYIHKGPNDDFENRSHTISAAKLVCNHFQQKQS